MGQNCKMTTVEIPHAPPRPATPPPPKKKKFRSMRDCSNIYTLNNDYLVFVITGFLKI